MHDTALHHLSYPTDVPKNSTTGRFHQVFDWQGLGQSDLNAQAAQLQHILLTEWVSAALRGVRAE
eukprot:8719646-Pyramimonas_sp.AAC.1